MILLWVTGEVTLIESIDAKLMRKPKNPYKGKLGTTAENIEVAHSDRSSSNKSLRIIP